MRFSTSVFFIKQPCVSGTQGPFRIWLRICEDNQQSWCSAVSLMPLWQVQRCHWHRCATNFCSNIFANNSTNSYFLKGIWLGGTQHSGVIDTTVTCTAVSLTMLCKYDTAETLDLIFERLWLPLKGLSIKKTYIGKLSCTIPLTFTKNMGVN
jgi:hypothetical protein